MLTLVLAAASACTGFAPHPVATAAAAPQELYDVVILGGRVMDPESGLDAVRNVGIRGGTVRAITAGDIAGRTTLDAGGLVVAPGFIDLNQLSHDRDAQRIRVMDGVTAAFTLMHGAADIDEWYAAQSGASLIHYGTTISHLAVRTAALAGGRPTVPTATDRTAAEIGATWRATSEEITRIRQGVEQGLARGALGVGLELGFDELGITPWEVIEVFRAAAAFRGAPVHVAVRKTREDWLETGEVFLAALATGAPLHITGMANFFGSDAPRLFKLIEAARARGIDITTEAYPYSTGAAPFASANYADWESWPMLNKGRLRVGADADITIFDPKTVLARATYAEPLLPSAGIRYVLVGGVVVVTDGTLDDTVAPGGPVRAPIETVR